MAKDKKAEKITKEPEKKEAREEVKEEKEEEKKADKKEKKEEGGEEFIYTINLSRIYETRPRYRRSAKALQEIRAFLERHTHSHNIKIDHSLNEAIWSRGGKKPPRRIQVRVLKTEEAVKASLVK